MAQLGYSGVYYLLSQDLDVTTHRLMVPYNCYLIICGYIDEAN